MRALRQIFAGVLAALGLACAGPALATIVYNSNATATNFDTTTAGTTPTGWNSVTGTWQVLTTPPQVSSHTHALGDSSKTNNTLAYYNGITAIADMEVSYTVGVNFTGTNYTITEPGVRYSSGGVTGYLCVIGVASGSGNTQVLMFKQTAVGSFTSIGTNNTNVYTVPSGISYMNVRFQVVGSTLRCKIWPTTAVEPTAWAETTTDTSYSAAGYPAIFNSESVAGQQTGATDYVVNDNPTGETNSANCLTPAPITTGGTVSCTFLGTTPTGVNIAFDGATSFTAVSSPTIGSGVFSFALPSATSGYHQMTVQIANATTEVTATPAFSITGTVFIAPNNTNLVYSPYNWTAPTSSVASSINAGAYLRTLFTGSSISLNFNTTNNSAPVSEIYYRIDGYEAQAPWTKAVLSSTIAVTMPADTSAAAYHLLELMVKSTSETINRWNAPSNTAVNFAGLTLGSGASLATPYKYPKNCIFFGDSRTEGVRTVNQTAANDTDRNDALGSWAWQVGERLGCEFGMVGFGAQGVTITGNGNVPPLPTSYALIMAGVSRVFTPDPDLIVIMDVGNDYESSVAAATMQAALQTSITNILGATVKSKIAVLQDFISAAYPTQQQAAVTAVGSARVTYVPTPSFFNTAYGSDSLNLHPTAANDIGLIAPQIAVALAPILYPTGGGSGAVRIGGSGITVP